MPGSSGFVGGDAPAATDAAPPQAASTDAPKTLTDKATPYMTQVGFSSAVGLVLGLICRTFIRLATTLTALIVAAALALSYFHVINLDLSAVKTQGGQATAWLTEQGGHLKDLIFAQLPSAGGAGAGFLLGMKRR